MVHGWNGILTVWTGPQEREAYLAQGALEPSRVFEYQEWYKSTMLGFGRGTHGCFAQVALVHGNVVARWLPSLAGQSLGASRSRHDFGALSRTTIVRETIRDQWIVWFHRRNSLQQRTVVSVLRLRFDH